ncbi:MAG: thioredoxin-dependent thiol peroxidase [Bacteroidales bacterium]|jgi:peroxiredoxin Q/BCP|nr:thioredoxin-dependent thiol peroxidase [Bacteroidales bacterium]
MAKLEVGDKAPFFEGQNHEGKRISLKQFEGKKLILYFYPKDNTPGCTAEACDLRDNYLMWKEKGYEILGISPDNEKSHKNFKEKHALPFEIICDPEKIILKLYDSWGEKKLYGKIYEGVLRKTFVINENVIIEQIIEKVNTKAHSEQILKTIK